MANFRNPNFGASLNQQQAQGVLPDSGSNTSTSASSDDSNNVVHATPAIMGRQYLAEGGAVDDPDQDSGNAQPASATLDPASILAFGRKLFQLPQQFFGNDEPEPSKEAQDVSRAVQDEGDQPDDTADVQAIMRNRVLNDMQPGDQMKYGDTMITKDEPTTMSLAEGGVIPDGNGDEDDTPPETDTQTGALDQQAAMAYLTGKGAVSQEQAAAMEQAADPQGSMEPNARKVAALQRAGSPQNAFGLMQHYRQKFNAYSAFAKAAIQGAGGRPPNGRVAADALNKAYENVPDGRAIRFTPVRGGFHVSMKKVIPSKPAPSGGEQPPPTQNLANGGVVKAYDDGGDVEYDDQAQVQAGAIPDDQDQLPEQRQDEPTLGDDLSNVAEAMTPKRDESNPTQNAVLSLIDALTPKRDENNPTQNFFLSIANALGWLNEDGQFDAAVDKGVDQTLPAKGQPAPELPPQMAAQAPQYSQGMQPGAPGTFAPRPQPQPQPRPQPSGFPAPPVRGNTNWPTPPVQAAVKDALEEPTLKEALHQIDLAYPFVSQGQQKALAKAQIIQNWHKDSTGIQREKLRNEALAGRTHELVQGRENVANINQAGNLEKAQVMARAAAERQLQAQYSKQQLEQMKQTGMYQRMVAAEEQKFMRAITIADPKAVRDPARMQQDMKTYRPVAPQPGPQAQSPQMQAPQAPMQAAQLPPSAVAALKEGQVTTFRNGQKWTLQGGKPSRVQ